jgi:hypothetical protein
LAPREPSLGSADFSDEGGDAVAKTPHDGRGQGGHDQVHDRRQRMDA